MQEKTVSDSHLGGFPELIIRVRELFDLNLYICKREVSNNRVHYLHKFRSKIVIIFHSQIYIPYFTSLVF